MLVNGTRQESHGELRGVSSTDITGIRTNSREWLGLRELTIYANVSERTLRAWIRSPRDPLPAVKIRGKVLVRKSDFDSYMGRHRIQPLEALSLDRIVQDVLSEL
jgi:excisionase family DNA binding protein